MVVLNKLFVKTLSRPIINHKSSVARIGSNTEGQIQIRGPKKYQIQLCELGNIQIHLFKYKYNTVI